MRYYVLTQDGRKFGPADVGTLSAWALEGRVLRETQLEGELDGLQVRASEVVGIAFPPAPAPPPPTDWSRPPEFGKGAPGAVPSTAAAPGSNELALAWVFSILTLVLCFAYGCLSVVFGPLGLYFSKKAESLGQNATAPRILSIVGMALGALYFLGLAVLFLAVFSQG